jgi:NhaC family Na+:H+ antiporter
MGDGSKAAVRPLRLAEAATPIVALIVLVGLSYFLFGDEGAKGPNQVALVMAAIVALAVGRRAGHTLDELRKAAIASVGTGVGAIFILFAVGALTGTWAMCGTLLTMVYYGLQLLSPNHF